MSWRILCALAILPVVADAEESGQSAADSIWSGIYTEAQARRGESAYAEPCGKCHGRGLDGAPDDPDMFPSPPLAGPKFLREWDQRTLLALFEYSKTTMPANNPGYFSDRELVDVIAYQLAVSGVPAGERELAPDPAALNALTITQRR